MSDFMQICVQGEVTTEIVGININQITYINYHANAIRLSDGLILHLTDASMSNLREHIGI